MAKAKVVIYSKANCPFCDMAKILLKEYGFSFEEIRIDLDEAALETMIRLSGRRTVPQIFINDAAIGGYDDLASFAKSGKLSELLHS